MSKQEERAKPLSAEELAEIERRVSSMHPAIRTGGSEARLLATLAERDAEIERLTEIVDDQERRLRIRRERIDELESNLEAAEDAGSFCLHEGHGTGCMGIVKAMELAGVTKNQLRQAIEDQ